MINIRNNVPDVYVRKSRDFQVLCNTFDCVNHAVKFDIDSIDNLTNTTLCNEAILPLLQSNLGFFTDVKITGKDLRTILKSFPYLLHNKGTYIGIQQAIQLFLKVIDTDRATKISIINNQETLDKNGVSITDIVYVIHINIKDNILDTSILTELLKYIIPAGYAVQYHFYKESNLSTKVFYKDVVNIVFIDSSNNRRIVNTQDTNPESRGTVNSAAIFTNGGQINDK